MKEAKILEKLSIRNRWRGCLHSLNAFIRKDADNYKTSEVEFRINKFQKKILTSGGASYERTTVPKALKRLESKSEGTLQIIENCGKGLYKILVHPLSFLDGKKFPNGESIPISNSGNPMFSEEHKKRDIEQQQQEVKAINKLFDKLKLRFTQQAILKIWRHSGKNVENVRNAVDQMLYCHSTQTKPIRNPEGWLTTSLQTGAYLDFHHQLTYELPKFDDRVSLMSFINSLHQDDPVPIPSQ
jgi:hypothetical protein